MVGLSPATSAPAVVVLMKSRRVIRLLDIDSLPAVSDFRFRPDLNLTIETMRICFSYAGAENVENPPKSTCQRVFRRANSRRVRTG